MVCRVPAAAHMPTLDSDPQMPGQSLETAAPCRLSRSLAVPQLTCHNPQICDNPVIRRCYQKLL